MTRRTEAQAEAARTNGSRSHGPLTVAGRETVATNAVKWGLAGQGLLLPHERVEDYEAVLASWVEQLAPVTELERRLVSRLADIDFRILRAQKLENVILTRGLDRAVAELPESQVLAKVKRLAIILESLALTVTSTSPMSNDARLDDIQPVVRNVADEISSLDLRGNPGELFFEAMRAALLDRLLEENFEMAWRNFGEVTKKTQLRMQLEVAALEKEVEVARTRLLEERLVGDERELAKVRRYQRGLYSDMDKVIATLKTCQAAVRGTSEGVSSDARPSMTVELRLIGTKPGGG